MNKRFPVLALHAGEPRASVPWEDVAKHEAQAKKNHYQDLETLAKRGGLSWCELLAVLQDMPWVRCDQETARILVLDMVGEAWPT